MTMNSTAKASSSKSKGSSSKKTTTANSNKGTGTVGVGSGKDKHNNDDGTTDTAHDRKDSTSSSTLRWPSYTYKLLLSIAIPILVSICWPTLVQKWKFQFHHGHGTTNIHPASASNNNDHPLSQESGNNNDNNNKNKIVAFLEWIHTHTEEGAGAFVHPSVTLGTFEEFGGGYGVELVQHKSKTTSMLSHEEVLFRIPQHLTFSLETVRERYLNPILQMNMHSRGETDEYDYLYGPPQAADEDVVLQDKQAWLKIYDLVNKILKPKNVSSDSGRSMVQQDWIIAVGLMLECSLGPQSQFYPYLQVLPQDMVPR
jgi:hypothetical protein